MTKVVVITGGSSGIGLCAARALLEKGCRVYELSRRAQGADAAITHVQAEVTDEAQVRAAVEEIVRLTVAAFTEGDVSHAYRIEPLEELIDELCDEMKQHHIQRVQSGGCTLSNGFVFNDLLTDLERVADHCSNIGVAMIEQTVELNGAHDYLQELRVSRTAAFEQYMAEYAGRFKV